MSFIAELVCILLDIYFIILLARIVLSWVPSLPEPLIGLARLVRAVTDPLLLPLRSLLPPVQLGGMALDLSPLVLFFAIQIVGGLLCGQVGGIL